MRVARAEISLIDITDAGASSNCLGPLVLGIR